MGRASRWLKSLFSSTTSWKKDPTQNPPPEKKKGWSFSGRKGSSYKENPGSCQPKHVVGDDVESKRAIAVAAATAAVAEAAVAAAEAAAAVVRLTSRGRSCGGRFACRTEIWAAVKIQSAFRGYLARRALKALRGIVKIQALVRGHIVRKQAAETLRCMQALVRAQARIRAGRLPAESQQLLNKTSSRRHPHEPSKQEKEPFVSIDGARAERSKSLKRNFSRAKNNCSVEEKVLLPPGSNWLDQWMSKCYCNGHDDGKNEKILEVDGAKPHSNPKINSKLRNRHRSMCSTTTLNQNDFNLAAMPASPSKDSTTAQHSMMSPSSVEVQQHSSSPLGFPYEADSFYSACSRLGVPRSGPFTPSKSECSQSFLSGISDCPSYMSYTESSRSKVRSHSAPRQRPEHEKFSSLKKSTLQGCGEGGHPFSSSQRSFSLQLKFAGKAYPGSGRLDRLGVPIKI